MVCSHCQAVGHNKRTCPVILNACSASEARAAASLAAMLDKPKAKKSPKALEGLAGCKNIWKEVPAYKLRAKKSPKALEGLAGCKNIWKESPVDRSNKGKTKCKLCGNAGHNARTCTVHCPPCADQKKPKKSPKALEGLAGCKNIWKESPVDRSNKGKTKCKLCGVAGHNARTCNIKCLPCADQIVRAYCFAGMTQEMAVRIAKILECTSIYGETEEDQQISAAITIQRHVRHRNQRIEINA